MSFFYLFAGPDRHMAILRNSQQPGTKACPAGIETMDALRRNDEDLLGHFFGHVGPAARQRKAKPVHSVEVPLE